MNQVLEHEICNPKYDPVALFKDFDIYFELDGRQIEVYGPKVRINVDHVVGWIRSKGYGSRTELIPQTGLSKLDITNLRNRSVEFLEVWKQCGFIREFYPGVWLKEDSTS